MSLSTLLGPVLIEIDHCRPKRPIMGSFFNDVLQASHNSLWQFFLIGTRTLNSLTSLFTSKWMYSICNIGSGTFKEGDYLVRVHQGNSVHYSSVGARAKPCNQTIPLRQEQETVQYVPSCIHSEVRMPPKWEGRGNILNVKVGNEPCRFISSWKATIGQSDPNGVVLLFLFWIY